ncbi:methylated-DNA--[protein]-cysteine S-methyltransferase [Maritalea porphyrae]|uniref:methylated-DNA--[protein]-cysteine S-methyltransferase n=1 Tax=Maritalea porphyrae TaxID=880732 RepID=UPI0022AFD894|nr:methylated-DNA--[protein]-cysteine S-methyltransferase [Maritalea porphyrae]MCZ4272625.1 methylated-DNA--[protein]-cysteine S-methyltransferase [Maritalea porphyrae]
MSATAKNRRPDLLYAQMDSPLGTIMVAGTNSHLLYLDFPLNGKPPASHPSWQHDQPRFASAIMQLNEYFAGERTVFDLNIQLEGSAFNKSVWTALTQIPFGDVITYGELAGRIGQPEGAQAVGNANGQNPLPIIVPCHRVIAAKNNIGGFTGGVEKKQFLLQLEKAKNVQFNLF